MTDEIVEKGENRVYEVGYLLLPSVPEERLETEVSTIKTMIKDAGGSLISEEDPKSRHLAYEMTKRIAGAIERYHDAYFGWIKFEVSADALPEMIATLDKSATILRYLLVKTTREDTYRPITAIPNPAGEELDKSIDELVAE